MVRLSVVLESALMEETLQESDKSKVVNTLQIMGGIRSTYFPTASG